MKSTPVLVLMLIALAGCKREATGQSDAPLPVLSGTISDAMLPFDTTTSKPPLDPRAAGSAKAEPGQPAARGTTAADRVASDAAGNGDADGATE